MADEFVYSIDPHAALADLDEERRGVFFVAPPQVARDGEWWIEGAFQLPADELAAIDEQPHRALVLVAQLGGAWYADTPLRSRIFFADDLHAAGKNLRGWFRLELFSLFGDRVPGRYVLSVSLGEHLSDSIEVEVR